MLAHESNDSPTSDDAGVDDKDIGYVDGSSGRRGSLLKAKRHGSQLTLDHRPLQRWGWALFFRDRAAPISGEVEHVWREGHTSQGAELRGVIALLDAYGRYGGQGPLLVLGDNRSIIDALNGEARFRQPELLTLVDQVAALAGRIPQGVRYQWLPRDDNQVADRLASHSRARSWGAEACLWWVSTRLSAVASASPADIRCRRCAHKKPTWCPLSPAGS